MLSVRDLVGEWSVRYVVSDEKAPPVKSTDLHAHFTQWAEDSGKGMDVCSPAAFCRWVKKCMPRTARHKVYRNATYFIGVKVGSDELGETNSTVRVHPKVYLGLKSGRRRHVILPYDSHVKEGGVVAFECGTMDPIIMARVLVVDDVEGKRVASIAADL